MEDATFKQLIESGQSFPEVTDVIYDANQMEKLILNSVDVVNIGFDTIWDKKIFNFHFNYLREGFDILEKVIEERCLRIRLIVETTHENIEFINNIKYYEIRHLDSIRTNFGIMDERAYMLWVFHEDGQKPEQAFFSNSISLVKKQQVLFDKIWKLGIPLRERNRQLENEQMPEFHKKLVNFVDARTEIMTFLDHSKMELLILSSIKMLDYFADDDLFWLKLSVLYRKGVLIKLLTDGYNRSLIYQLNKITNDAPGKTHDHFQIGYSTKLGNIDEFVLITDNKEALELTYADLNQYRISFLNDKNHVLVQEILFEKYWNEVNSLEVMHND